MYEDIKRLYLDGKLTVNGLIKAIEKGWITEDELEDILKSDNNGI